MGLCTLQENNPKEQTDLVLSIVPKIHFQFQQSLPKRYISFRGVLVTFFVKILSVRDEKSDLSTSWT